MSTDPQLNATNYILNIVPIQNIITNISGLTPIDTLTRQVTNIQEMVDYSNKRINANTIASFANATDPISVVNSMNLCNANLYSNGVLFTGGGTTSIFTGNSAFVGSTGLILTSTSISLNIESNPSLFIDANSVSINSGLVLNSNPIQGTSLQCLDLSGTAAWGYVSTLATANAITFSGTSSEIARFTSDGSLGIGTTTPNETLDVNGTAAFTGRVSAFDFLTLSDRRFKTNITRIENAGDLLDKMRGVRFMWRDLSSNDIGVIAQELQEVLPEAVLGLEDVNPKLSVAYHKIIPVLIEVVKDLQERVRYLESVCDRDKHRILN